MATKNSQWPATLDRTPESNRCEYDHGPGFQVDEETSLNEIEEQLEERIGADEVVVHVLDPEVVAWYVEDGKDNVIGCDSWDNVRDNARAIAKYIDSKLAIERYDVATPQDEWANTNLPEVRQEESSESSSSFLGAIGSLFGSSDSPDVEITGSELTTGEAEMILGVAPGASDEEVRETARELAKEHHPDNDGNKDQFQAVMNAKEQLL